jgi:hypothetical protein
MAYPTIDKPYGLKPVNLIGGQVFAGSTRLMEIATTANVGYGTDIFYGDLVKRVTGGTIEKDTGTTTATPSGVFLGCQLFRMRVQPSRVTRLLRYLVPALQQPILCLFVLLMWFETQQPALMRLLSLSLR